MALVLCIALVSCGGSEDSSGDDSESGSTTTTEEVEETTTTTEATTTTLSREQLTRQVEGEIEGECIEAYTSGDAPSPDFDQAWSEITDASKLAADVKACVDTKNQADLEGAQPVDVDAIVKDPDSVEGQVFEMVVLITQYDAATGSCAFRGYWDQTAHEYNFDYAGDNALFIGGDGVSECPVLDGIDQDDTIRVWAKSTGSFSYDTQIGGSTTVPAFKVLKAEVLKKE